MNSNSENDDLVYTVVVNLEQQYSIWPAARPIPAGWSATQKTGRKSECLDYISSVWTDMRPLSLRKHMEELLSLRTAEPNQDRTGPPDTGQNLVERLSHGRHSVAAELQPEAGASALRACIEDEYVHIRFTDTAGGTILGVRLDTPACRTQTADFAASKGSIHLEGELTLNGVRVRCICDLDLSTCRGTGYLVPSSAAGR